MQKNIIVILILLLFVQISFSQNTDSLNKAFHFKGLITVTNKGISLVPTFTLGKPAAIFDLSMGKKKLFFEPQLRFSLSGKPWSVLFWWRYKLLSNDKIAITLGAHPALNFRTDSFVINGEKKAIITTRRYVASELAPNYLLSKNVSIGFYYLYSRGLDYSAPENTHFLTMNSNFSYIQLSNKVFARFNPQFYYLNQDGRDGFYFTSTLTLARRDFPLSVQSIINKIIDSEVPGSQDFVWNVSLIYSFNKNYVRR